MLKPERQLRECTLACISAQNCLQFIPALSELPRVRLYLAGVPVFFGDNKGWDQG